MKVNSLWPNAANGSINKLRGANMTHISSDLRSTVLELFNRHAALFSAEARLCSRRFDNAIGARLLRLLSNFGALMWPGSTKDTEQRDLRAYEKARLDYNVSKIITSAKICTEEDARFVRYKTGL